MVEEAIPVDHLIELLRMKHLSQADEELYSSVLKQQTQAKMMDLIEKNAMAPYYEYICQALQWTKNDSLHQKLSDANATELNTLEEKIKDAEENLGESEHREALLAKANFYARIGDKAAAILAYRKTQDKSVALGHRLDICFNMARIGFAFEDADEVRRQIEKAKSLVEEGGDWERRNRLKVYEALYSLTVRNFEKCGKLLLDAIATFSSGELMSYREFIFYTILVSMVTCDRPTLRSKVIDSPEVLSVIESLAPLSDFLNSLYNCNYKLFFSCLPEIDDLLRRDPFFAAHASHYIRELRILAYKQFLESYRTVSVESMARLFGCTVAFLDRELSRFIASGRLNCKINKVDAIIQSTRPDAKNSLYTEVIKKGDALLNRIQKLSRVMDS